MDQPSFFKCEEHCSVSEGGRQGQDCGLHERDVGSYKKASSRASGAVCREWAMDGDSFLVSSMSVRPEICCLDINKIKCGM